jgi:glycosyltransferase involved in cell wall biosynthesis
VPCAGSILSNVGDDFELLIVDQSEDNATEQALAAYAGDRRFRYIRSSSRGASAARNVGVEQSTAPIIAFTDDDCRVSTDWLRQIATLLAGRAVGKLGQQQAVLLHQPVDPLGVDGIAAGGSPLALEERAIRRYP